MQAVPEDDAQDGSRPPRRQRRKEDRPGEIIEAAMRLWAERGFAATRLEDVARGAGIAKGTIYLYFPSKEALFEAAVRDRFAAALTRAGDAARAGEGGTADLLAELYATMHAQIGQGGLAVFLKVLLSEGHRFPGLVAIYRDVAIRRGMETVAGLLARGVARGELAPGAEATDPRVLIAPVLMAGLWREVFGPQMPIGPETLADFARVVVRGLAAAGPDAGRDPGPGAKV